MLKHVETTRRKSWNASGVRWMGSLHIHWQLASEIRFDFLDLYLKDGSLNQNWDIIPRLGNILLPDMLGSLYFRPQIWEVDGGKWFCVVFHQIFFQNMKNIMGNIGIIILIMG